MSQSITCPICGTVYPGVNSMTRVAAIVAGALIGAFIGSGIGLVGAFIGALVVAIFGGVLGGVIAGYAISRSARCPKCGGELSDD
ncbi:MAG: hypothetical protein KDC10_13100 [Calditrichaeota bacterium]|nr:hypothetical protein [Candidatus Cloacimonadota bacterium]MCA9787019.1 hypothetical protein [Candidatus Cloacimonadota bacterium]MCB1048128.1 hypothetical protein [Calditrichota bacterium]MCB9475119.1 hypothetical protein [Candidatus Delongbacteria bacterium]